MEDKLKKSRDAIDEIDTKILKLLLDRKDQVIKIGEYKREKGLDIFDPARESDKLEKLNYKLKELSEKGLKDKDDKEKVKFYIEKIFFAIMDESKKLQEK